MEKVKGIERRERKEGGQTVENQRFPTVRTPHFSVGTGCEASSHSGSTDNKMKRIYISLHENADWCRGYNQAVEEANEIITRQKAEVERLLKIVDSFTETCKLYSEIKADAIKAYHKTVKECLLVKGLYPAIVKCVMDEVEKEMVGDV